MYTSTLAATVSRNHKICMDAGTHFDRTKSCGSGVYTLLLLSRVTKTKTCAKCGRSSRVPATHGWGPDIPRENCLSIRRTFSKLKFSFTAVLACGSWVMLGDDFCRMSNQTPQNKKVSGTVAHPPPDTGRSGCMLTFCLPSCRNRACHRAPTTLPGPSVRKDGSERGS